MFTGFMVDASNIFTFRGIGNLTADLDYSIEFWIFKPTTDIEQAMHTFNCLSILCNLLNKHSQNKVGFLTFMRIKRMINHGYF